MERGYLVLENERLMSEIKLLEEEIEIRERVSDSYRISATISGRITDLSFPYLGMAVKKGEPILKISNLTSPYAVTAQVGERNFDLIKVGTSVRMESKVFDSVLEGFILGKVTKIDPEGKHALPGTDGNVTFEIEIEVDEAPHPLVRGSSLDVYFLLGKRSLLKTLFDQPEQPRS